MNAFFAFVDRLWLRRREGIEGTLLSCIGLTGEGAECLDLVKKSWVYGQPLDTAKLLDEAGDTFYYLVSLCITQGWTLDDLAAANMAKLNLRYPTGYSDAAAIARADQA